MEQKSSSRQTQIEQTQPAQAKQETVTTSAKPINPVVDWLIRLGKGMLIGIGAILPGLSGGALSVIFGDRKSVV